jgi:hypothetical protein
MMLVMVSSVLTLAAILTSLWRTIASDAYGIRPPPRSHHDEETLDQGVRLGIQAGSHRVK